ncbi:MAG: hypothetical protein ABFE02_14375 [Sulfuricella sp.]
MIELGPGADLFRMVGAIFWLVVIGAFVAALLIPKTRTNKAIAVTAVAVLFAVLPGRWFWEMKREADGKKERLAKAEAIFQEHCKTAGEKIYRTVDGVEGILLMKVRPNGQNHGDQFKMDDPYGDDLRGDGYIETFLRARDEKGHLSGKVGGYRYVEAIDQENGKRYRYTGRVDQPWLRDKRYGEWVREFVLDKNHASSPAPRYGVTYDDISTPDDRVYWIAGSSLKVIDLKTNEVVAERIGYMMDRGQGALSTGGSQTAWLRARRHACPPLPAPHQTRNFVEKSLKTIKEN